MNEMTLEEKIKSMDSRLQKLEAKERRREIMAIIRIIISVLLFLIVIASVIMLYQKFTDAISPFQNSTGITEDYDWNSIINEYLR